MPVGKAAILTSQHQPLVVDTFELPDILKVGQVYVELVSSGICGSQVGEIKGAKGNDRYLPHLMGHEGFARVLEIGPGVTNVQTGDHVVLHWRPGAGIQGETPQYKWRGEKLNAGWVTTFNTHAIVSENRCTKVPKNTNPDTAALLGCAITTGFGVVENDAKLKIGESIVVFGSGGIGLNVIQAASMVSGWPIIAIDQFDSRLALAKNLGADYCINSKKCSVKEEIQKILGGNHLDVFIDNTGIPEIIELGYEITKAEGRIVLVGVPRKGHMVNLYTLPLHFGKTIIGSSGGGAKPQNDIPRYLRLEEQGHLKLKQLVSAHFSLEDINNAIKVMCSGETAGRVMIKF